MTAKVFDLAAARARPRPESESLRFRLDPDGSLVIRPIRSDGIVVPSYVVPDAEVDGLLASLAAQRGRLKWKRHYAKHPLDQPKAAKPREWTVCRAARDGGRGLRAGGCRRREKHAGQCRDEHGDFTPALCIHVGRPTCRIVTTTEAYSTCSHCHARLP